MCCNLFALLFLVTPCQVVAVQPCMDWTQLKKMNSTSFICKPPGFFQSHGFNILTQKYFSEEWKQIYQFSFQSKMTKGNIADQIQIKSSQIKQYPWNSDWITKFAISLHEPRLWSKILDWCKSYFIFHFFKKNCKEKNSWTGTPSYIF